jgi:hypothetical protein
MRKMMKAVNNVDIENLKKKVERRNIKGRAIGGIRSEGESIGVGPIAIVEARKAPPKATITIKQLVEVNVTKAGNGILMMILMTAAAGRGRNCENPERMLQQDP